MTRYQLSVTGPVPRRLVETISQRFGNVRVGRNGEDTVLDAVLVDQPSLRALLTLLWDAGHDVRDISSTDDTETAPATCPRCS